jgi:hypothetical protein
MMSPSLGELFNTYGTDKDRNGYTAVYEPLFKPLRYQPVCLLEVGIGSLNPNASCSMLGYALEGYKPGGSLRAWRDYFHRGQIVGVDVEADTQFAEPRITTLLADSLNLEALNSQLGDRKFHIIIDDACHYDEYQIQTLKNLWSRLQPGGYYIIENIPEYSRIPGEFRQQLAEFVGPLSTLYFTERKNLLIITKANPVRRKDGTRKNAVSGPLRNTTRGSSPAK